MAKDPDERAQSLLECCGRLRLHQELSWSSWSQHAQIKVRISPLKAALLLVFSIPVNYAINSCTRACIQVIFTRWPLKGGTVLGSGDTEVSNTDTGPAHTEFMVWWGGQVLERSWPENIGLPVIKRTDKSKKRYHALMSLDLDSNYWGEGTRRSERSVDE